MRRLGVAIFAALFLVGLIAPATFAEAKFNMAYGVASALVHGELRPAQYTDAALADDAVRALCRHVEFGRDGE